MNPMNSHTPLLLPAVMLVLGILSGGALGWPLLVWLSLLVATTVGAWFARRRGEVSSMLVLTAIAALGAWLGGRAESSLRHTLSQEKVAYAAVVCSEPMQKGRVMCFDMAVISADRPLMVKAKLLRDTLSGARYKRLHVGDGLQAESFLEAPTNFYASTFDYARWLRLHGYAAETFILPDDWQKARVPLKPLGWWMRAVVRARKVRQDLLAHYFRLGNGSDEAAIVAALTLGDKSRLSKTIKETYSQAGAAHVLALSGLHLGILCSLFGLFRRHRHRWRWLSALLLLTGVWCFAFLTGLSPSVVRAAMMLSLYVLMGLVGRDQQPLNTLLATIIIMLVVQPLWLYDTGFQLSAVSLAAIQLFFPLLRLPIAVQNKRHWGRVLHWVWDFVAISVAAQLGTAPLVAYTFGRLPVYFLLANAIALPCATLMIYAVVLLWLSTPLPSVQLWVAKAVAVVAMTMNDGMRWVASLPSASVDNLHPTALQTVLCYVLLLILWAIGRRIKVVMMQAKMVNGD